MNHTNYKSQTNSKIGKTWSLDTKISEVEQEFTTQGMNNNNTPVTINFSD